MNTYYSFLCLLAVTNAQPTGDKAPPALVTTTDGNSPNGSVCVFPFTYKGTTYTKCDKVDNEGKEWCATSPDYGRDKLWGNCVYGKVPELVTTVPDGIPCVFPFKYKGRSFTKCITLDHDRKWCALTPDYTADKRWGNCVEGKGYESVGCFRDSSEQPAFEETLEGTSDFLDGDFSNRTDPIDKCYKAADKAGNTYFGIRLGECLSSCNAFLTYYRNSNADNCDKVGTGGNLAVNVFEIKNAGECYWSK